MYLPRFNTESGSFKPYTAPTTHPVRDHMEETMSRARVLRNVIREKLTRTMPEFSNREIYTKLALVYNSVGNRSIRFQGPNQVVWRKP